MEKAKNDGACFLLSHSPGCFGFIFKQEQPAGKC